MRILVYEHVSGGGYADKPLPLSVLSEGYAMLRGAVADFRAAGHEVAVLLDARLSTLDPPIEAVDFVPVDSCRAAEVALKAVAAESDAVLVIAPETGGVLQLLVETVERTAIKFIVFNLSSPAIVNG